MLLELELIVRVVNSETVPVVAVIVYYEFLTEWRRGGSCQNVTVVLSFCDQETWLIISVKITKPTLLLTNSKIKFHRVHIFLIFYY